MDKESERQLKKMDEFKNHLLQTIRDASPQILAAMNDRGKDEVRELLVQLFVDELEILNKVVITRKGVGDRFTRGELDYIKGNLLKVMK